MEELRDYSAWNWSYWMERLEETITREGLNQLEQYCSHQLRHRTEYLSWEDFEGAPARYDSRCDGVENQLCSQSFVK
ncbi:hypothetical protein RvY_17493 [Ramazzottius varieornatus]|uniref:Uncharacterized protein n=1 Tax=Ramazzottius varieornatus TaxID=947166 RepID=A0A1D1W2B6_RAMVA|nr:hypothetical protein RvY_17493 [Ramazzottius varieornatus]